MGDADLAARLGRLIREYPDFPEPGVRFLDLGPLYGDAGARAAVAATILARFQNAFDGVLAIDARGIPMGTLVASAAGGPLLLARKAGKLPGPVTSRAYGLEYGRTVLEVQPDDVAQAGRILVVDDVLATGGTAGAAVELVRSTGASVAGVATILELEGLGGRNELVRAGVRVEAVLSVAMPSAMSQP